MKIQRMGEREEALRVALNKTRGELSALRKVYHAARRVVDSHAAQFDEHMEMLRFAIEDAREMAKLWKDPK